MATGGATTADTLTKLRRRGRSEVSGIPQAIYRGNGAAKPGRICPYDNQVADVGGADPVDVSDVPNEMWHPLDWG